MVASQVIFIRHLDTEFRKVIDRHADPSVLERLRSSAISVRPGLSVSLIRLRWLTTSYHVATLHNDFELIVRGIGRFITDIDGHRD